MGYFHHSNARATFTRTAKPNVKHRLYRFCPNNPYIPHHRNLGLKPWATDNEIKAAWRTLSIELHPDKTRLRHTDAHIKRPSSNITQQEASEAAYILISEAYDQLYRQRKNHGPAYQYRSHWRDDPNIDINEERRRIAEDDAAQTCPPKPWVRAYKTYQQCDVENNKNDDDDTYSNKIDKIDSNTFFCDEFLVNLAHKLIDTLLPLSTSDDIWQRAEEYKVKSEREAEGGQIPLDIRTVYGGGLGPCEEGPYHVLLPRHVIARPHHYPPPHPFHHPDPTTIPETPTSMNLRWSYWKDTRCYSTPLRMENGVDIVVFPLFWALVVYCLYKAVGKLAGLAAALFRFLRDTVGAVISEQRQRRQRQQHIRALKGGRLGLGSAQGRLRAWEEESEIEYLGMSGDDEEIGTDEKEQELKSHAKLDSAMWRRDGF